jgi:hypothetical protein
LLLVLVVLVEMAVDQMELLVAQAISQALHWSQDMVEAPQTLRLIHPLAVLTLVLAVEMVAMEMVLAVVARVVMQGMVA